MIGLLHTKKCQFASKLEGKFETHLAQNKDIGAVWQTLLGGVLLTLRTQARRVEALPVSHARAYLRNRILTFILNSI